MSQCHSITMAQSLNGAGAGDDDSLPFSERAKWRELSLVLQQGNF